MPKLSRRMFIASLPSAYIMSQVPAIAAPATDLQMIAQQKLQPAIVTLHRRLERLTSALTIMTTGAHPDDEPSGMLAALRYFHGIHPVMYCITRGEGGQNSIGPERGSVLGVLRTREMEEASRALDASLAFGAVGHNDSVHDFGFSKDPNATINRWGKDKVIERMTWAFRTYKPDIIMNCFLDVGGQHGHHRAANVATFITAELSNNPNEFQEQIAAGLTPWDVPKIYLPAYGGGGGVYDDETPPPPVSTIVRAPARDKISGATFPQMGEWSRSCHLTQQMGRWREEPQTEWELHLARVAGGATPAAQEEDITDGLLKTVGHIAELDGIPASAADALRNAQGLIEETMANYADPVVVLNNIAEVGKAIASAQGQVPAELQNMVSHRIARKLREVDQVLATAAGLRVRAYSEGGDTNPGKDVVIKAIVDSPDDITIDGVEVIAREGLNASGETISVAADAEYSNPLNSQFEPLGGNGDAYVRLTATIFGHKAVLDYDLEEKLRVIPESSVEIKPNAVVFNTSVPVEPVTLSATINNASADDLAFELPEGWDLSESIRTSDQALTYNLTPPTDLEETRFNLEPTLKGKTAYTINTFTYPHIGKSVVPTVTSIPVQSVPAELPNGGKVGYVGSGNDNVGVWMRRLGIDVVELSPADINSSNYRDLKTIVIGIFAFGPRKELTANIEKLHQWVRDGGHLITLYHRPSDGWNPDVIPLAYLKIGTPSIRYRVTDANAVVTVLDEENPILNYPNKIGESDWANWDKERGLYFASEWSDEYTPLLSMHDEGEEGLVGSMLTGKFGLGRHTHTSLVLHHQLDKLTPGAFRILANLVQPAEH